MTERDDLEPFGHPLIGRLLRVPWETVQQRMLQGLHERGFVDIHPAHLNVLQYPGPQNIRPLDLAARTRMSKQALNHLLGQMERLGYLSRRIDPDDQRHTRVDVTPRGVDVIGAIRDILQEIEAEWAEKLGPRRFAQLRRSLAELGQS